MKTILVIVMSIIFGVFLNVIHMFWMGGVNPFISNVFLVFLLLQFLGICYIIFLEKNTRTKFIQIGILLTCIGLSFMKIKSDLNELLNNRNTKHYYQDRKD